MLNNPVLLEALQKWRSWSPSFPPVVFSDLKSSGGFQGIVPSRDTVPSSMAIPTEDTKEHQHQGWETFFPGPHSPSQLHFTLPTSLQPRTSLQTSEEGKSRSCFKNHYSVSLVFVCFIKHLHSALPGTSEKHFGGNDYNGGFSSHFSLF